jgi:hypothetical protein
MTTEQFTVAGRPVVVRQTLPAQAVRTLGLALRLSGGFYAELARSVPGPLLVAAALGLAVFGWAAMMVGRMVV